jgi:methylglutaconyl-CoA hydratase
MKRAVAEATSALLEAGPDAIAACKRLVREATLSLALADLPDRIAAARVGPEGREGVTAFLERRSPRWSTGS